MNMLIDLHTHTIASTHAYSTLLENLHYASLAGLKVMGTSDHAPQMPNVGNFTHFVNLKVLPKEVEGVRLLRGIEANILDDNGSLDIPPEAEWQLDYAIASLHTIVVYSEDVEFNTNAIIRAMDHPLVKVIGHPEDVRYPKDFDRIAKAAAEKGVALELNNSSLDPNSFRKNGRESMKELISACLRHDTKIILGTDSHFATAIGDFTAVLAIMEEVALPPERVVNHSVEALEELLGKKL